MITQNMLSFKKGTLMQKVSIKSASILLLLSSSIFCAIPENPAYVTFLDTDLQYGNTEQVGRKLGHASCIQQITNLCPSLIKSSVVVAGDFIEGDLPYGEPGLYLPLLAGILNKGALQTQEYKDQFLLPLEANPNMIVIDTVGNHEFYDPTRAALNLLLQRHGALHYITNFGPFVVIVGAAFFDEQLRTWLAQQLATIPMTTPILLVNHFNGIGEHDIWYHRDNDAPLAALLQGRNVIRLWGHNHSTYKASWEGHECYCGGGAPFIALWFDAQGTKIGETAYMSVQQADGSYIPEEIAMPAWQAETSGDFTISERIQLAYNSVIVNQHFFD